MNDLQLYDLYKSIELATRFNKSKIYPDYVVITGRSFVRPHPHRHYTFDEFVDKINEDIDFRNFLNNL